MSSRDRPKRGIGGSSSNSNTSSSPSRATRSSSSSNNAPAPSSSTSRPVRSTRSKATNHIEYNSDEEDDNDDVDTTKSKPRLFKTASTDEPTTSSKKTAVSVKVDPDKLAKLESITGLSRAEAMQLLEASGNKLDVAVELHFGTGGPTASTSNGKSTASSTKSISNGSGGSKRALNSDEPKGASNIVAEDNDDGVRAPIPTRSEKLLDYDPYGKIKHECHIVDFIYLVLFIAVAVEPQSKKPRSVFDGFRDLQEEYNGMFDLKIIIYCYFLNIYIQ